MSPSLDYALDVVENNIALDNSFYSNYDSDRDIDLQDTYNRLYSKFSELRITDANILKKLRMVEDDRNNLVDKLKDFDALKTENLMCGDKIKMLEESRETCVQNASSSQKNIDGMFPRKHSSKFIPTCHHCGAISHIRPNYFQLNSKNIVSSNVKRF
jgi:hypothetical protein